MADRKIKRALISVYDKTGIVDFARALHEEFGVEILSTGGTAKVLTDGGIPVTPIEQITGCGEMLDGRVKTLHPKVFAAILADRDNPSHMQQLADAEIEPIDMVVVNLYPFEQTISKPDCTFEEAIEMIDIGGPSLLRAAAKNHKHVAVLVRASWYKDALRCMRNWVGRKASYGNEDWASEVFSLTSVYDRKIGDYLQREVFHKSALPPTVDLRLKKVSGTRYGENPHQDAGRYVRDDVTAPAFVTSKYPDDIVRTLSYNNFVDAEAALGLCEELARGHLGEYATVFVKHTNPCGVGVADEPLEAYRRAYLGDPKAAMGGVLACGFAITKDVAGGVMDTLARWGKAAGAGAFFADVWLAPRFDESALDVIRKAKKWGERVRLLNAGEMGAAPDPSVHEIRSGAGYVLMQARDLVGLNEDKWEVATERAPSEREMNDLRLAWLIAKHTKSNAISLVRDGQLIGNGAGQMSRVMSCRVATWLAGENGHLRRHGGTEGRGHGGEEGFVAASDGFFPFRDGPEMLMDAGATAIIQPGGSKRDAETVAACHERGAAMIFTHTRHFRH